MTTSMSEKLGLRCVKGQGIGNHPLHPGFRKIWLTLYERVVHKLPFQTVEHR